MAGRTPREAVDAFLEPLKEVIGCVTDEGCVARIRQPGGPFPARFQNGFAILDRTSGLPPIGLTLTHSYTIVPLLTGNVSGGSERPDGSTNWPIVEMS